MPVFLLDSKHPTLFPIDVLAQYNGRFAYTSEVPNQVRDAGEQLGIQPGEHAALLITSDLFHPEVVERIVAGEQILRCGTSTSIDEAVSVMHAAVVRGAWERDQTHNSLLPYLHEEVAEFVEAVADANPNEMRDELADILLQVLFHAEIADEFDVYDVAEAFVEKMRSRAPYLFDGSTGIVPMDVQERAWQAGKTK